jgi:hypothetical protein
MKLLLENWREYLTEEISEVKVVSPVLYYWPGSPEPGRLFLVAEFEVPWWGETMKYGFYTTSAESLGDASALPAGSWLPVKYIREEDGVLQKIKGKYPQPKSLLSAAAAQLNQLIPPAEQTRIKRQAKREMGRGARRGELRDAQVSQQIENINNTFKEHGVYDLNPQDPYMGYSIS